MYANPGLGLLALLAAEGRIHQDHVEQRRRIGEQPLVRHLVGQRVAVQDVRLVDVVEDEVGQGDGIDRVVLLPTVEGAALEGFELFRRRDLRVPGTGRVLVSLGKEAARTATGVVHRLAHLGIDDTDHRPDDLARSEELAAVVPLLAHLEQEPLVHLGEWEDVRRVHVLIAEAVDPVEDIEEVLLGVDARALDARHNLADHLLPRRRPGLVLELLEIRQQLVVDEGEHGAKSGGAQVPALRPVGISPVPPAIGRLQRGSELGADRLGLLGLALLALVQDPEEEDPQFDRRMMSQMDFTAVFTDCWVARRRPLPLRPRAIIDSRVLAVVYPSRTHSSPLNAWRRRVRGRSLTADNSTSAAIVVRSTRLS